MALAVVWFNGATARLTKRKKPRASSSKAKLQTTVFSPMWFHNTPTCCGIASLNQPLTERAKAVQPPSFDPAFVCSPTTAPHPAHRPGNPQPKRLHHFGPRTLLNLECLRWPLREGAALPQGCGEALRPPPNPLPLFMGCQGSAGAVLINLPF